MTTKERAIKITKENLHLVFGETSAPKRLEKISELYVPSEVLFVDPMGVFKTHEAISDVVTNLQAMGPGQVFSELGEHSCIRFVG